MGNIATATDEESGNALVYEDVRVELHVLEAQKMLLRAETSEAKAREDLLAQILGTPAPVGVTARERQLATSWIRGLGSMVSNAGLRIQGFGFWVSGVGCWV